jgi:hypothetical protein
MDYGLRTFRSDGTLQFDSSSTERMQLLLPAIILAAGSGTTVTYPSLAGRQVMAQALISPGSTSTGGAASEPAVDYALGYPRVTVPSRGFSQYIIVYLL